MLSIPFPIALRATHRATSVKGALMPTYDVPYQHHKIALSREDLTAPSMMAALQDPTILAITSAHNNLIVRKEAQQMDDNWETVLTSLTRHLAFTH